jgi:hypothetical protein
MENTGMRNRIAVGISLGFALLMPFGYHAFFAFVRNEHFYRCFPTSYWERAIKRWHADGSSPHTSSPYIEAALKYLGLRGEPAIFEPDDCATPVLLDLIRSEDNHVRCAAIFRLAETLLYRTCQSPFWSCGDGAVALSLPQNSGNQTLLVLRNWRHFGERDQDTHDLVLIDEKGHLLDRLSWSIDNPDARFGAPWRQTRIESVSADDQAPGFIVRATLQPTRYRESDPWSYEIFAHGCNYVLAWNANQATTQGAGKSMQDVLCRFTVLHGKFEVISPVVKDKSGVN